MAANLATWWRDLDDDWKKLFLINYVFQYRFSDQMKRELLVPGVNPFDNYYNTLEIQFETFDVNEKVISDITRVEALFLANSGIKDISAFKDFKKLKLIDLSYNQILDTNALVFPDLEKLYLERCSLDSLSFIGPMKSLKELYVRDNYIKSAEDLSSLENLEVLDIGVNEISNLNFLKSCTSIIELSCDHNYITKVEIPSDSKIQVLNVSNNSIESLDFIFTLRDLRFLDVTNNPYKKHYNWAALRERNIELKY